MQTKKKTKIPTVVQKYMFDMYEMQDTHTRRYLKAKHLSGQVPKVWLICEHNVVPNQSSYIGADARMSNLCESHVEY